MITRRECATGETPCISQGDPSSGVAHSQVLRPETTHFQAPSMHWQIQSVSAWPPSGQADCVPIGQSSWSTSHDPAVARIAGERRPPSATSSLNGHAVSCVGFGGIGGAEQPYKRRRTIAVVARGRNGDCPPSEINSGLSHSRAPMRPAERSPMLRSRSFWLQRTPYTPGRCWPRERYRTRAKTPETVRTRDGSQPCNGET